MSSLRLAMAAIRGGINRWGRLMPIPISGTGITGHAVNRAFKLMVTWTAEFDAKNATSHSLRAGVPAQPRTTALRRSSSSLRTGSPPAWWKNTPRLASAALARTTSVEPNRLSMH
ncbi:hypothetical protein AB0F71_18700 [Kitasatospora sp. NPDC028055]|uniref:hypothetical protein n=1 Tax=Kitasatospora sp. NPDC028055 TaxID=3155653 RepID=UPI0033DC68FE